MGKDVCFQGQLSGPQGSGRQQGQGQGRAPVGACAHPGLDGRKPVITSELRHPECHPHLGCRAAREPVQCPQEVPCSAQGRGMPFGEGDTQPHGRPSSRWESGRQSLTPSSQELGTREAVSVPCSTRDAPCSRLVLPLSSRLEGPAASLPGHTQTRACPVYFRPGCLPALWRIAWNCCPSPSPSSSDALALELLHPSPTTTNLGFSGSWASAASPLVSLPPLPLAGLPVSGTQRRGCRLTDARYQRSPQVSTLPAANPRHPVCWKVPPHHRPLWAA